MLVTKEITNNSYVQLLKSARHREIYHSENWLQAVNKSLGAEIRFLETTTQAGSCLAITPFFCIKKGPFKLAGSPLRGMHTEFLSPVFFDDCSGCYKDSVVKSQHEYLVRLGYKYIEWSFKYSDSDPFSHVFSSLGYKNFCNPTMVVDLTHGEEAVWNNFESRARNMIRKSEKNGVVVEEKKPNASNIESFYGMLDEIYQRQGKSPPHPQSFYHEICFKLAPLGSLYFFEAKRNGSVIAGAIFLQSNKRLLFLSGASNKEGSKYAANSLIHWHSIKKGISCGAKAYDLGGVGQVQIDKFKKSFGGLTTSHRRFLYRPWYLGKLELLYVWLINRGLMKLHG